MIGAYNTAVSERSQMVMNSSESSPLVKKLDDELRLQRTAIVHSLDNLISQLQAQVNSWEKNEAATNKKLAGAPQQVKQLLSVSRQQKVKEQLYLFLLQKREESELSKTFTAWNTRVVQPPYSAGKRTPQTEMILLIAFVVGLLLPLAYLYLREALNHTVRGRADLDNMKIPLLGEIPAVIQKDHWWKPTRRTVDRGIYIKENCRDLINESFRIFRTKFDYFLAGTTPRPKVIMLTSFNPGSGKSFLSVNLAKVESLNGKRVLCIDFDFRHCSLSAIFDSPKRGITDYIVGFSDNPDELIVKGAIGEGADVLPVGIIPPNPTELLLHERVGEIITKVRDNYDLIILDCPPIDVVADANIVKQFADVTLFVIRAGLMDRRSLKEVERLYKSGSYKHTALILNGSTYIGSRYGSYRYGYSYGYSYGYNYSDGKKFKK